MRTPVAVGALWLIAAWVTFFLVPKGSWDSSQIEPMLHAANKVPLEVRVGVGSLLLYALGIFLEMLGRYIRAILILGLFGLSVIVVAYGLKLSGILALVGTGVAVYIIASLIGAAWRRSRVAHAAFADALIDSAQDIAGAVRRLAAASLSNLRVMIEPDFSIFYSLMYDHLEWYFNEHQSLLPGKLDEIDIDKLASVAQAMGVSGNRMHRIATPEQQALISTMEDEKLFRYYVRNDEAIAELARSVARERLRDSAEARRVFAAAVFDHKAFARLFRCKLQQADIDLRAEKADLFPEWDRLMAEGEFRRGVSIPLIGVLVSVGIAVMRVITGSPHPAAIFVICCAAVVVGFALYRAGTHRIMDANRMLYSCIVQGRITLTREKLFGHEIFMSRPVPPVARVSVVKGNVRELRRQIREYVIASISGVVVGLTEWIKRTAKQRKSRRQEMAPAYLRHCVDCRCNRAVVAEGLEETAHSRSAAGNA